jgi:hypothetical protein
MGGGDITVEGEAAARLIAAGLHDVAVHVGGEVDLEPVPRERVMPQDDIPVAAGADAPVVADTQDAARFGDEDPHVILIRVKVEVPDRHGRHQAPRPGSFRLDGVGSCPTTC